MGEVWDCVSVSLHLKLLQGKCGKGVRAGGGGRLELCPHFLAAGEMRNMRSQVPSSGWVTGRDGSGCRMHHSLHEPCMHIGLYSLFKGARGPVRPDLECWVRAWGLSRLPCHRLALQIPAVSTSVWVVMGRLPSLHTCPFLAFPCDKGSSHNQHIAL